MRGPQAAPCDRGDGAAQPFPLGIAPGKRIERKRSPINPDIAERLYGYELTLDQPARVRTRSDVAFVVLAAVVALIFIGQLLRGAI